MRSHIFLFGSLPRRRPPEFTAILMFEFWREATATSVPGLLCQSGRRRPQNVSILSSLVTRRQRPPLQLIVVISNMHDHPCQYISFDSKVLKEV